ncbi:MAG: glycogen/starch/alpha-glucan phosphorylase [Clostridiales bacterium]|jgi:starch phosphorylase|nr:glycogen/starch/alpha-glucan phosphorylase [Clostridiales bacterium]
MKKTLNTETETQISENKVKKKNAPVKTQTAGNQAETETETRTNGNKINKKSAPSARRKADDGTDDEYPYRGFKDGFDGAGFSDSLVKQMKKMFGIMPDEAEKEQMYKALCTVVKDILTSKRVSFKEKMRARGTKQVYYMSVEFLLGRSLKNHLMNLGMTENVTNVLADMGFDLSELCDIEQDAGLGNGGLGRLAAAYMDALTSKGYAATGFSIRYDYGIFKQKIADGWQLELPDEWLNEGGVWLAPRVEDTFEIKFGGRVDEEWSDGRLYVKHKDYTSVLAVPYDMNVSGYASDAVNTLRLWSAKAPVGIDLKLFSQGEYVKAMESKSYAESISKILYPADNHYEGKSLRLKQQYFFVSASVQSILKKHLKFNELSNLPDRVAIHINDTHPALCVPELMRILLDDFFYSWEDAWSIVKRTVSYTNHTVMSEALERWPKELFKSLLPRIYQITEEIDRRFRGELGAFFAGDPAAVDGNAIIRGGDICMANLCVAASHTVNGVSALHSEILKNSVFRDYYRMRPQIFTNVTNGITHRRWLTIANPELASLLTELIGGGFITDAAELKKFEKYKDDKSVLLELDAIKRRNKARLAEYIAAENGVSVSPDAVFDVQVKRLHEYKRQLLNALNILDLYFKLKDDPNLNVNPRVFVFGAKAASSYTMAKQIIRLIYQLGELINNDKTVNDKLKVVFLENYRVTLAELIIPAANVSEQISVAGKEASGTGNMKFMINGAVTVGTMDGANIEIFERVGGENIFIFGLRAHEIERLAQSGYNPSYFYNHNADLKRVIDALNSGVAGVNFRDIADGLTIGVYGKADPYFVMADFESYSRAQAALDKAYNDKIAFNRMSLLNIAGAGFFAADRSVTEYAERIWHIERV